ncbi:MAG: SpoIIE family protein phosphatase [Phycisphaerales bacterium]|nr:MAG: SpoIIE family protein phosphatase [Phycisphaerales bacterium]
MAIRWKLLILLLLVALVPVVLLGIRATRGTYELGRRIGQDTRAALIDRAEERLGLYIEDKAELMRRATDFVMMALRWQADRVERALASEPQEGRKVYVSQDFQDPATAPPDLEVSDRFVRVTEDGGTVGMQISRGHQVFVFAPGADAEECEPDVQRLAGMSAVYRQIAELDTGSGLIFWQYTGLENGLYSSYPGYGPFPEGYDHRRRAWYRRAKSRDGLSWMPPYLDATSRRTVLSAMMPVRRPDGSFAGVTAIDVTRADLMQDVTPAGYKSAVARLVIMMPHAEFDRLDPPVVDPRTIDPSRAGLYIVAVSEPAEARGLEARPFEAMWLESADEVEFLAMMEDMKEGRSAVRAMEYEGRHCLWAYGRVDKPYLVAIVPQEDVVAEADAAQAAAMELTWSQLAVTGVICGVVVLIVLLIAFFSSRAVTTPLQTLAEGAERIAGGDFDTRVAVRSADEIGQLAHTFNDMVPKLRDQVRMRSSLAVAMEVQQSLLPDKPPKVEGFDIAGRSIYCDETGGDYYDFIDLSQISPHKLGVALGDVTGHGIAAALLMATARGLLRIRTDQPGSLGDLLSDVNAHLTAAVPAGRFMTLSYMLLDSQERVVRWASAGHDPAIVYTPSRDSFDDLGGGGLPLGIDGGWEYEEYGPRALEPGQVVVVGTDGIWEARDDADQMFGMDRLRQVIRDHHAKPAAKISEAITSAVTFFRGDRDQDDDITLVVVKVLQ